MTVDEKLLAAALAAATEIDRAQQAVEEARAQHRRAVRALYLDGASMREIADRLGISHQRVHQLLDVPKPASGWRQVRRRSRADARGQLECQFCGRSQAQVRRLIAGAGTAICSSCTVLAHAVRDGSAGPFQHHAHVTFEVAAEPGACGFCGKRSGSADSRPGGTLDLLVVPGRAASICGECLDLATEIIAEEQ